MLKKLQKLEIQNPTKLPEFLKNFQSQEINEEVREGETLIFVFSDLASIHKQICLSKYTNLNINEIV